MESMYKVVKLFDCSDMPRDVKDAFFEGCGDNCHKYTSVTWQLEADESDNEEDEPIYSDIVTKWLLDNGANADDSFVLISVGW